MRKRSMYLVLLVLNLILTSMMLLIATQNNKEIVGKLLIVSGVPIVISVIVYFVVQYALENGNYDLIGGYNKKNNYNIKELKNIIIFIRGYVITISFICNFIIFILSFYKKHAGMYQYILYLYLINFFIGIIYINVKKKDDLYMK